MTLDAVDIDHQHYALVRHQFECRACIDGRRCIKGEMLFSLVWKWIGIYRNQRVTEVKR